MFNVSVVLSILMVYDLELYPHTPTNLIFESLISNDRILFIAYKYVFTIHHQ